MFEHMILSISAEICRGAGHDDVVHGDVCRPLWRRASGKKGALLAERLVETQSPIVRKLGNNRACTVGLGRFPGNRAVMPDEVFAAAGPATGVRAAGPASDPDRRSRKRHLRGMGDPAGRAFRAADADEPRPQAGRGRTPVRGDGGLARGGPHRARPAAAQGPAGAARLAGAQIRHGADLPAAALLHARAARDGDAATGRGRGTRRGAGSERRADEVIAADELVFALALNRTLEGRPAKLTHGARSPRGRRPGPPASQSMAILCDAIGASFRKTPEQEHARGWRGKTEPLSRSWVRRPPTRHTEWRLR